MLMLILMLTVLVTFELMLRKECWTESKDSPSGLRGLQTAPHSCPSSEQSCQLSRKPIGRRQSESEWGTESADGETEGMRGQLGTKQHRSSGKSNPFGVESSCII